MLTSKKLDLDEFASFNQQLAGMLKAGLPLEGSLEQLSVSMSRGHLRSECEALQRDLQSGQHLADALTKRDLPGLYKRMVTAAASGGGLAATLGMAGDYYGQKAASFARVRALLVYPMVVILMAVVASMAMVWVLNSGMRVLLEEFFEGSYLPIWPLFVPTTLLVMFAVLVFGLVATPLRRWFRWRISPFKEEALSQFAATAACLLRSGVGLRESVDLLQSMEGDSLAGRDVLVWSGRMEQGLSRFDQIAEGGKAFPPLFRWLVVQGGEDLAAGFERASVMYRERALRRQEAMKQLITPLTTAAAGCFVIGQFAPTFTLLFRAMTMFGL